MGFEFEWNELADQPHNVAPKSERLKHHLRYGPGYLKLIGMNLRLALPVLALYRRYRKSIYKNPVVLDEAFGAAVSPVGDRNEEVIVSLKETGVRQTLVRFPSWERGRLDRLFRFCESLRREKIEFVAALLQNREDVLVPDRWKSFLKETFSGLNGLCSHVEVGHAWNRTKWGVWDYREYLDLARPAAALAGRHQLKLIGPAVIDFEFHLYPAVLPAIPFDKVTSLLYVDRKGAPENSQFGWDTTRKIALLKAAVDKISNGKKDLWITEVNWPLEGTGKYSPASGKPNVSEDEQASYLVRYYALCLASGFVERVYWWQLVAPGYGLIDNRTGVWRKRPGFFAFQTMVGCLAGSRFLGRDAERRGMIFYFRKDGREIALCWTNGSPFEHVFARQVSGILSRDGEEISDPSRKILIEGKPKYVFFAS